MVLIFWHNDCVNIDEVSLKREVVMKISMMNKLNMKGFVIGLAVGIFLIVSVSPGLLTNDKAEALVLQAATNCGKNQLCKSLEGTQFDLVRYANRGVNIVILYDRSSTGDISFNYSERTYSIVRGTVNDAVRYVSNHSYYAGFSIRQARKSTGFLKSEDIAGMYLMKVRYDNSYEERTPRVTISEKDGKIKVRIAHDRNETNE